MREYSSIVLDHMIMQNSKQKGAFSKAALNRSLKQHAMNKQMVGDGLFSWINPSWAAGRKFTSRELLPALTFERKTIGQPLLHVWIARHCSSSMMRQGGLLLH